METSTRIISYKSTLRVKRLLNSYAKNLKTSKAKIINYAFFEMFVKNPQKTKAKDIAEYMVSNKLELKKDNYTLHILNDYYAEITNLKKEVQLINNISYHDNEFIGSLLSFYFDKASFLRKKKVNKYLVKETQPKQIGIYLNKALKETINETCESYQLNAGLLLFDILTDTNLGDLPFKELPEIVIDSEEKERIIIYLPRLLHEHLNSLPLTNSFISEIRAEQYIKKYKIKQDE